ncbi:hypothetical protein ACTFIZ_000684 [Dictyostelium cf. discoideum]
MDSLRYKKKLKIENSNNNYNNNDMEKLFFSIFRNKYLNNLIFTNLKTEFKKGIYRYDEIVRVGWMIKNHHTELLKYKVLRGEQLIFTSDSPEGPQTFYDSKLRSNFNKTYLAVNLSRDRLDFKKFKKIRIYYKASVFNVFKDDEEFFKNLFNNYKLYFQLPQQNQKKEINGDDDIKNKKLKSLREIKYLSLVYDNVASIKVINEYYYSNGKKFSFNFFKNAIAIGSFKVAQYIFNQLFKSNSEITESQLNSLWFEIVFVPENIYFTKDNNFNEKIEFLIEKIKIPQIINDKPNESPLNSKNPNLCIHLYVFSYPLSVVIDLCKTILRLNILNYFSDSYKSKLESILNDDNSTSSNSKKNNNQFLLSSNNEQMKNNQNLVLKYINEIESFKSFKNQDELNEISKTFTEQQLSTTIGEFNSNDKRVKLIYEMAIIHIFIKESIIENFLFHKFKYNRKMISNQDLKSQPTSGLHPKMFGIFYPEKNSFPFSSSNYKNPFENVKFTGKKFCYVKNQKELIIQYYKDAIEQVPYTFSQSISNIIMDLIKEVVLLDDIELVKMVFESFPPLISNTSVIQLIESPLIFDYIKDKFEIISGPTVIENSYCFNQIISNYKIANHFKNNYYQQYNLLSSQENISQCDINFMIENFNDFKNNINLNEYLIKQFTKDSNDASRVSTLNKLIDCIENSKIEILSYICPKVENHYHVLKNYPHKIKTNDSERLFTCYYLNGQFDKMKEMIFSKIGYGRFVEIYTIFEIVKRNDISTMEFLINSRQQQVDQTQQTRPKELFLELIRALNNAARIYGNLNIFKKIKDYFETIDFDGMFYISFQYGYIHTIDFLIKDLNFKPDQERFEQILKNQSSSNNYTLISYFEKVFEKESN